jgi:translation initiation factor IF-2
LPARIYSLAKELKLDSKVLVDICTSAGVTGKGSALASLTDEEVDRVKAYIAGGQGARTAAPSRPRPAAATTTAEAPPDVSQAVRREDYIAPAGAADKVPVLSGPLRRKKPGDGEQQPPARPAAPKSPGIKLAPLPTAVQPPAKPAPAEAPAQKPDLRLPIDAIKAASRAGGTKPLIDHVRKQQQAKRPEPAAPPADSKTAKGGAHGRGRSSHMKEMISEEGATGPVTRGRRGAKAPAAEEGGMLGREQRQLNRRRNR